ncbi:MAG: ion transporter [Planctomycetaceae bacterium]|jgi:voltage-gated potassium channel|nr:ion transporter [Planctomycetaceae bacterium]
MNNRNFYHVPYQLFMLMMTMLLIGILLFDTAGHPTDEVRQVLKWTDYGLCVLFLFDCIYQIIVAKNKVRYLCTWGLIDIVSCIPVFGWGRFARVIRILKLLKGIKTAAELVGTIGRKRGECALLTAFTFLTTGVLFGSIAILQCETEEGNINNAADALWWTFCTMMKGGCENFDPVTAEGRCVAAALSLIGLGVNGTIIAFVASLMISDNKEKTKND